MKIKYVILIIAFLYNPKLFAQQTNLWQSLSLDFNQIYLSNTAGPSVMYYDSVADASYIAGTFQKVGDSSCNVVRLGGNGFTFLPSSPLPYTYDIIRYHGKLYFSGPGLATWDGYSWALLDSINGVGSLTIHNDSLWAVLTLHSDSGEVRTIGKWTGHSWQNMYRTDTLIGEGTAYTLVFYKGELYIGGNINNSHHPNINEIARFDGTRWRDVGHFQDGNLSDVRKLLVWKDTLYVGGSFRESDGSPGNGIAKWDGDHWHRLSRGVLQSSIPAVTDMKVLNDNLYITGWFYWVDGIQFPNISFLDFAKWDGHRWCTMGTHADNVILTMGEYRDSLYIMGAFDSLNNQPMHRMAKWIGGDYTDSCSLPDTTSGIANQSDLASNSLSVFPNPTTDLLNIHFHSGSNQKQEAAIQIADLSGRVMQAGSRHIEPGGNFFQLDVSKLAPGMYFLTLINGQDKLIVKFVKQ